MIVDPYLLITLMLSASFGFVIFLFLPPAVEIIRPKLRQPRKILKMPLQKRMRRGSKCIITSDFSSVDSAKDSKNLPDILDKAGAKWCRIGKNTVRIFGDFEFPPKFEVFESIVVLGALTVGDECVFHGSVKVKRDVLIGCGVVIKGNLISEGNVNLRDDSVVAGLVHSEGSVRLGEKVFIGLSVVASGDVELYEDSEVKKNILTRGSIRTLKNPDVGLSKTLDDIG
jgi:carbonic anhydrase/acetyltransferase-like protein (isoleucine patch superfamily)